MNILLLWSLILIVVVNVVVVEDILIQGGLFEMTTRSKSTMKGMNERTAGGIPVNRKNIYIDSIVT